MPIGRTAGRASHRVPQLAAGPPSGSAAVRDGARAGERGRPALAAARWTTPSSTATWAATAPPRVYYRLRLVDRDNSAVYSPLVSLTPDAAAFALSAWPNPFGTGPLSVQLALPQAGDVSLVVYDAVDRLVLQRAYAALAVGTQSLRLLDARPTRCPRAAIR